MSTFYQKIDFVNHQCIAFAAEREHNLPTMPIARLHIEVDRQDSKPISIVTISVSSFILLIFPVPAFFINTFLLIVSTE